MRTKQHPTIITIAAIWLLLLSISTWAGGGSEVVRVYHVPSAEMNQLRYYGDVWARNWREDYVYIHVTPRGRQALEDLGYAVETDHKETGRLARFRNIDREAWRLSGAGGIPGFPCYRTVDETHATLADLVAAYPQHARLELIGQSWQAQNDPDIDGDIFALVIANQDSPYQQAPLVIMAAQHARELTTAEAATRFAELLLEARATNGDIAWLLDHREIHIIAQQNPDGRRQVEGQVVPAPPPQGSMWRKNHNSTACGGGLSPQIGIDLNRNSSFLWGAGVGPGGSSGDPCNQTYRGTIAASEPETQAVEDYLAQVFEHQRPADMDTPAPDDAQGIFISLHSFSELVLFPWDALGGGAANHSPNHDQLAFLGRKFGYHTGYQVGRDILYQANGTTTDYAYGQFGVAAYTYELGTSFLQTCASFESTVWPDVRDALLYAAKAAERPYQAPSGPEVIDLEAAFNLAAEQVQVTAVADGTRYGRGGVSEDPADDPVFDIAEAVASFDLPPHLAANTFSLTLEGTGSVVGLSGQLPLADWQGDARLLFVTAADEGNHTGVPTAVWLRKEPRADISPDALTFTVPAGGNADDILQVGNDGAADLVWSIETALPEPVARRLRDPDLDETLGLPDFTLQGSVSPQLVSFTVPAGAVTRGEVTGFSFQGTVSGIGGSQNWAADMCMMVEAPDGTAFAVGGFTGTQPGCTDNAWGFDGDGSSSDGTYSSRHDDVFDPPVDDRGDWTFTFVNDWSSDSAADMSWTDVTITLHKAPLPVCLEPGEVDWLSAVPDSAVTPPGDIKEVTVIADASGLAEGVYEAHLCLTTNDVKIPLSPIPVQMTVIEPPPGVLEVEPAILEFGEVWSGHSEGLTVNVSNAAGEGEALQVSAIEVSSGMPPFSVGDESDCQPGVTVLEPGERCTVEVRFMPDLDGEYAGELLVAVDDGAEGQSVSVSISGTGIRPPPLLFEDRFEVALGVGHGRLVHPTPRTRPCRLIISGLEINIPACRSGPLAAMSMSRFRTGCAFRDA